MLKDILAAMVCKLREKSPLKYKAVKGLSSLDPSVIIDSPNVGGKRLSLILEELHNVNIVDNVTAENAKKEYGYFCEIDRAELQEIFKTCETDGLDISFRQFLRGNKKYKSLWKVVQVCLVFSHGNATVEGGFSVNKSLIVENMIEKTVVAQRHIYEEVEEQGGVKNIKITKQMLDYVRGARKRYQVYFEEQKERRSEKEKKRAEKRKLAFQMKDLEEQKKQLIRQNKEKQNAIEKELNDLKTKRDFLDF